MMHLFLSNANIIKKIYFAIKYFEKWQKITNILLLGAIRSFCIKEFLIFFSLFIELQSFQIKKEIFSSLKC